MKDFIQFIGKSPTAWHTVEEIAARLKGFHHLSEQKHWSLELGKTYFVEREGTLLFAFRLPKKKPVGAVILASHTDSPALKIKPNPDIVTKDISQLGTEVYGGPLLHSWFDRDLAISGRIETDRGSQLVHLTDHPVIIPQLAIHLDKSIYEKGLLVDRQDHLRPILSINGKLTLESLLKKHYKFKTLYAFDLFLVPTELPTATGELVAGYRLDNLTSAYASTEAMLEAKAHTDLIQCAIFWNHEEIGSMTSTGAGSLFIDQILERITLGLGQSREDFLRMKTGSIILSADVSHGFNPNFADKYDPQNSAFLGQGVILKFNASMKYATDATSSAILSKIAAKYKLKLQKSANRSNIGGGSTVGPIMSATTSIPTIDLGLPLWAMHSTREIIAQSDQIDLGKLLKVSLEEWSST
jgi:aspartyl aminopeptidase